MKFYKSKLTNRFVSTNAPAIVEDIFGKDSPECKKLADSLIEVIDPTLIDLIRNGNDTLAVIRYRGMYPKATVRDAMKVIRDVKRKMAL